MPASLPPHPPSACSKPPPAKVAVTRHSPSLCLGMAGSSGPKEAAPRRAAGRTEPLDLPGSLTARQGSQALPGEENGPSLSAPPL